MKSNRRRVDNWNRPRDKIWEAGGIRRLVGQGKGRLAGWSGRRPAGAAPGQRKKKETAAKLSCLIREKFIQKKNKQGKIIN
jgi:hypothetical protein